MRIWRSDDAGLTYVERGAGAGVIIIPDHGSLADVAMRFRMVDPSDHAALVHDPDGPRLKTAGYAADAADRIAQVGAELLDVIASARVPATVKAELRDVLTRATGVQ
jgi:hypothetical protein